MVIYNTLDSNCTVLIKLVRHLRHALNVSVKRQFRIFSLRVKYVAVIIFFSKYTLKGTTNEMNLTKIGAKTGAQAYQLSYFLPGLHPRTTITKEGEHPPEIPPRDLPNDDSSIRY